MEQEGRTGRRAGPEASEAVRQPPKHADHNCQGTALTAHQDTGVLL